VAAYIVSFPVVVTRSVVIVTDDINKSVELLAVEGAGQTDALPSKDKTVGFYSDANERIPFRFEMIEPSAASAPPLPKGTVLQ
jgi:hypothetical protein